MINPGGRKIDLRGQDVQLSGGSGIVAGIGQTDRFLRLRDHLLRSFGQLRGLLKGGNRPPHIHVDRKLGFAQRQLCLLQEGARLDHPSGGRATVEDIPSR